MAWSLPGSPSVGDFIKASWGTKVNDNFAFLSDGTYIEDSLVDQGALKTTTETQSNIDPHPIASLQPFWFGSAGSYGLFPQTRVDNNLNASTAINYEFTLDKATAFSGDTGTVTRMSIQQSVASGSPTAGDVSSYATIRYVQATPPHPSPWSGEDWDGTDHGLWFYEVRETDGTIRRHLCTEPPYHYLARQLELGPLDPDRFTLRPHPLVGIARADVAFIDLTDLNRLVEWNGRPVMAWQRMEKEHLRSNPMLGVHALMDVINNGSSDPATDELRQMVMDSTSNIPEQKRRNLDPRVFGTKPGLVMIRTP